MGFLSRASEAPVKGSLIIRFEFAPSGLLMFSLDNTTPRAWYAGHAELLKDSDTLRSEGMEELLNLMMPRAVEAVIRQVPSLKPGPLNVQLDDDNGTTQIVCVGDATYLRSEWRKVIPSEGRAYQAQMR